MSQNVSAANTRDLNNNNLYHGGAVQGYGSRPYPPAGGGGNNNYQQVTAKVVIRSVKTINDLKRQEKVERDMRRPH